MDQKTLTDCLTKLGISLTEDKIVICAKAAEHDFPLIFSSIHAMKLEGVDSAILCYYSGFFSGLKLSNELVCSRLEKLLESYKKM